MDNNSNNPIILLIKIWKYLTKQRKEQFILLVVLMLFNGFGEFISLGSIIPFIGIISDPTITEKNIFLVEFFNFLNIQETLHKIIFISFSYIVIIIFSSLLRYFLLMLNAKFTFSLSSDLSILAFKKNIIQPYEVHINRNSSEIINGITGKIASTIYGAVQPFLVMITSIVLAVFILCLLAIVNFKVIIFSTLFFLTIYITVFTIVKGKLSKISHILTDESTKVVKILQESVGGIRDIILDESQDFFTNYFEKSDKKFKNAQRENLLIGQSPKIIIEALLLIIIAFSVLYLSIKEISFNSILPILAAFILGAQRLIPAIQQIYNSLTNLRSARQSILDTLNLINFDDNKKQDINEKKIQFTKAITITSLNFQYINSNKMILDNINLEIIKGDKIGVIGTTGSGKSTFVDILMGLLTPTKGKITVDNIEIDQNNIKGYQKLISHVPQNIFLTDSTIYENIAFGKKMENIDFELVELCAKKTNLHSFISRMPESYFSIVAERGSRLSGGQRQRIGIARALYKKSQILILDEATNALDYKTESEIIDMIFNLDKDITVIIIAHRIETLKKCNKIYEVDDCSIKLLKNNEEINV